MLKSKKREDAWEDAALEKIRLLKHQLSRAQDCAVRLEQALAEARHENELLRNIIEGMRMRNYELLKESDQYAELFGLVRYTMEPGIPEDLTVEVSDEELERLRKRYGITQTGEE